MIETIGYILAFFLLLPLLPIVAIWPITLVLGWYYDDLDNMNLGFQTLREVVLFGYAHLFARWLLCAGYNDAAAKIYGIAGASVYRTANGHVAVSHSVPEDAQTVFGR